MTPGVVSRGMGVTLTPKSLTGPPPGQPAAESSTGSPQTVEELRQRLLAMPLPPHKAGRRPYPTTTMLGRLMRLRNLMIRDVLQWDGAPNNRQMTEYLAGRVRVPPQHRAVLAAGLGVDPRLLG
jgi:hypothetical protein